MKPSLIVKVIIIVISSSSCGTNNSTIIQLCDANANRYASVQAAQAAGLDYAEFGATFCPEYKMHPSWDTNNDGINDCASDGSCNANSDYMSPRP